MVAPLSDRPDGHATRTTVQRSGLIAGAAVLVVLLAAPALDTFVNHAAGQLTLPTDHPDTLELARGTQTTLAILALMVIWWITEAAPIPVTALVPGVLLPLLHVTGVKDDRLFAFDTRAAFAPYASPIIYLFLAGFLLAGAMRKTGLDRRITLTILSWRPVMRGPSTILLAVMGITAFLSMWISNTATTAMMLPIALTILAQLGERPGESRFGVALMLGVAWAASIGGIATLIGSPPNGIAVGILQEQNVARIDFLQWMQIGLPVSLLGLLAAWGLLLVTQRPRIDDPAGGLIAVREARMKLGPLTRDEIATVAAFALVVTLWVTRRFWDRLPPELFARVERFDVYGIGLFVALLLFIVPVDRTGWRSVLDWRDAKYVDWGILILFGGGMAL